MERSTKMPWVSFYSERGRWGYVCSCGNFKQPLGVVHLLSLRCAEEFADKNGHSSCDGAKRYVRPAVQQPANPCANCHTAEARPKRRYCGDGCWKAGRASELEQLFSKRCIDGDPEIGWFRGMKSAVSEAPPVTPKLVITSTRGDYPDDDEGGW